MQIKKIGEFGLIERVARIAAAADPQVVKAIGDDAAVMSPDSKNCLLVTTDILKEGIHFKPEFSTPYVLGKKCLSVNLSDIAAMGGAPTFYFVCLAIPSELPYEFIRDLYRGMAAQARRFGAKLLGGDTSASQDSLLVSVTLLGRAPKGQVLYRNGARTGDLLYVTGTLGDSALGLALLKSGQEARRSKMKKEGGDKPRPDKNILIARHNDPQPRVEAGFALARSGAATAMMDVSDGLLGDLRHILGQSGAGARIYLDRLPLSAAYSTCCPELSRNYYLPALCGGEDYELLFTSPAEKQKKIRAVSASLGLPMTCIGEITGRRQGLKIIGPQGRAVRFPETGFRHF